MKKRVLSLIIVILLFVFAMPIGAQSAVEKIRITNTSTNSVVFPEITVDALLLRSDGTSLPGLSEEMIQITENGNNVFFEMEETLSGSYTVLVFDLGKWIANPTVGNNSILVKDIMLEISLRYIESIKENDFVEIVVIYEKEPILAQVFTNDKQQLREAIQRLNWENYSDSYGIEAAHQAVISLSEQPDTFSKRILFFSTGIMMINKRSSAEYTTVARNASSQDIFFNTIHVVDWREVPEEWMVKPKHISEETGGVFVSYLDNGDLTPLYQALENNRTMYKFKYRSAIGSGVTERTVNLSYLGGQQVSDSNTYTVAPAWVAPASITVTVSENIAVNSEKEAVSVPIHVVLNGLGNRKITNISFWVNDQEIGGLEAIDDLTYTTTWQFSPKNLGLNYGDTAISLVVKGVRKLILV